MLGALARVDAIPTTSVGDPKLDLLRTKAVQFAVALRRISKGSSKWPIYAYDPEKLRVERALFEETEETPVYDVSLAPIHLPDPQVVDSVFKNIPNARSLLKELLRQVERVSGLCEQATHVEGRTAFLELVHADEETPAHVIQFLDAVEANERHIFGFPAPDDLDADQFELVMTKFRLSGMLAPLQEHVSETGDGAPTNKNIKDDILRGSTFHYDQNHPGVRHISYPTLKDGSVATLAFASSSPPRQSGIRFNDPDQSLIGGRKTLGQ